MAELLNPAQITALESAQSSMKTDAAALRGVLNTKKAEDIENLKHNAFVALVRVYDAMVEAIMQIEGAVARNDDDYKR